MARRPAVPPLTFGGRPAPIAARAPQPARNPDAARGRPPATAPRAAPAPRSGSRRARSTIPDVTEIFGAAARQPSGSPIRTSQVNRGQIFPPAPPPRAQGKPIAQRPVIVPDDSVGASALYADDRAERLAQKQQTNALPRSQADTVRGYVEPGLPQELPRTYGTIPQWRDPLEREAVVQAAEDEYAATGQETAPYSFPQVSPTRTSNPARPRTLELGWEQLTWVPGASRAGTGTLRVRFRDGTPWEYYDVPKNVYENMKRVTSPGKFINDVLNNYQYAKGHF